MQEYDKILSEEEMISLADNMASAATTFNSHGYDTFISARQIFLDALHKLMNFKPQKNPL